MYSKKHSRGASMVEYAILVAIIAVAAIAGVTSFGDKVKSAFDTVGTKVTAEASK
jgi:pilus assembly protein Flp/PilA